MMYRLMYRHVVVRALIALAASSIAGCDTTDPFQRRGEWHPRGANDANLAAMVDNPMDLVRGRRDDRISGQLAAAAIARMLHDQAKPLISVDTSQIGGSGSGGGGSAPAGAQ